MSDPEIPSATVVTAMVTAVSTACNLGVDRAIGTNLDTTARPWCQPRTLTTDGILRPHRPKFRHATTRHATTTKTPGRIVSFASAAVLSGVYCEGHSLKGELYETYKDRSLLW